MWSETPFTGRSLAQRNLVLTFDDGPGPSTVGLAEYLAEESIQAVFFVVGKHGRQFPSAVTRLLELGHLVGNHSENHLRLTSSSVTDRDAISEFVQTQEFLSELQVPQPTFFRGPYGAWNPHLAHLFRGQPGIFMNGAGPVNWDVCGRDYLFWSNNRSAEACSEAYVKVIEKHKKGIVLFHDFCADGTWVESQNKTIEMVSLLVPRLRELGYGFSTLGDIPELKPAVDLGVCRPLPAMNGKLAEVNSLH